MLTQRSQRICCFAVATGVAALLTACAGATTPTPSDASPAGAATQAASEATPMTGAPDPTRSSAGASPTATQFTPGTGVTVPARPAPSTTITAPFARPSAEVGGVQVRLQGVRWERVQARGPGEISGPAAVITIQLHNRTAHPVRLDRIVATLMAGGAPAMAFDGPPSTHPKGPLMPGAHVDVVRAFAVAESQRDRAQLTVSYDPEQPPLVFSGALNALTTS